MLLYVQNTAFQFRTFLVRVDPHETVARVRAQLLHTLYELGKETHQFRLRYKGQYLRDSFSIEDYGIIDNSLIKMIPLLKSDEEFAEINSLSERNPHLGISQPGLLPDVKQALEREVRTFNRREELIYHFKSLLYFHFLAVFLSILTSVWYSFSWTAAVLFVGAYYCPTFTRFSGFIGGQSIYKNTFCWVYGILSSLHMIVCIYFCITDSLDIAENCCLHQDVFSAAFFGVQAVALFCSSLLAWLMLSNFRVQYGDYVEKYLVRTRDIEDVMNAARSNSTKVHSVAAFELATLAAASDDNKFRIVAEGGLEVLMRLALTQDVATQEYAVETITELLTVPVIQENFVEMGGIRTLGALLHAREPRLVYQAATALSYIVSDTEDNKDVIISDHGLDDLVHAASVPQLACQRVIASIFLELAFSSGVRVHMGSLNSPARALMTLCKTNDTETQRYALQTLELLAIESVDMICAQEELREYLLVLPEESSDSKVLLLAGKILLYYAENIQSCEAVLDEPHCRDGLSRYARTNDPLLQKVVAKLIFSMLETGELSLRVRHLGLDDVLTYICDHAADRESRDMAEQGLILMNNDGATLNTLPMLSTMEKIEKMDAQSKADQLRRDHGSRASLGSRLSLRSTLSDTDAQDKKGLM